MKAGPIELVCVDCLEAIAYEPEASSHHVQAAERWRQELGARSLGAIGGELDDGRIPFSRVPCPCCRNPDAGERHGVVPLFSA